MALRAHPLLSSSSSPFSPPTLPIPRLRLLQPSRPSKRPSHSCSRSAIPARRNYRPGGHRFSGQQDDAPGDEDDKWRWAPSSGDDGDSVGGLGWGDAARGGEVGEWDPPVSPFRGRVEVVHHHHEEEEEEEEEDEDGIGSAWSDPAFFLRSLEEEGQASSVSITTAAMEEILAFARSPAAGGQAFARFLAGYGSGALSVEECVELMRRMGEEGLALGCLHLLRWMLASEEPLLSSPKAWLLAVVALGRAQVADEVMEIVESLPRERRFGEVVLYNAAMSSLAYCGRYDDAWKIFKLIEENNIQPDHMTSLIVLNVMNKSSTSAKEAWEFFQLMDRKGVKWSLDTCISLIKIFCDEGLKTEALIIQKEKKDEFWKNRKKRSMMNQVYGYPRKKFL
uniref:Pentacotripeptide-repeat region of PRORP domain-containing protein n=1 Tax=Leersia perrieri TaxID=77586 RepID=A0A0D9WEQ0_9ORYZ